MKKNWKTIVLILSFLVGAAMISWSSISYIRKEYVIAKYLKQDKSIIGDINDSDEYVIYNSILEESGYVNARTELILINDHTSIGLLNTRNLQEKPWSLKVSDETWKDFYNKNQLSDDLGYSFAITTPYLLVKYDEMEDLNIELWGANVHYTPFLEFSRVGFNQQKNEAIVHLGITLLSRDKPAMRFMSGNYYWLIKVDGKWMVEKEQGTYIT